MGGEGILLEKINGSVALETGTKHCFNTDEQGDGHSL